MTHWIWYVIAPLVIIGCALFYLRRYQRNKASATAYATERGWTYTEHDQDLLDRCHGAPFDGRGRRRRAWHAVRGQHGPFEALSFEYSEVRGRNNRNNQYARREFRQLTSLQLPFPAHEIYASPRGRIGRFANQAGLTGSGTGNPDIDREWSTHGLISPPVQEWLANHRRPFRVSAGRLETWHSGRFDPTRIDPALADLEDLAARLAR
ncbi:hypothetical protein GCM10022222_41350 [Amycolatopsis ultiminotia]|uniref:Uncharacterized protein n=1 Tax=Amycolatopsis ultiminotia TaxID=543629 RepID=A0ABP6WR44_9PSEU